MASEKPKVKKKTTVSRAKRGGVTGTLTTTRSSSSGKPKKSYTQLKAEGGDVSAAKAYNKSSESFRADAPNKMPLRGAKVTPKTTPKPKLVPKVIPAEKSKTKPTKGRTPVGTPSLRKKRGGNKVKGAVIKVKKAVKKMAGKIKSSCKAGGKGKCGPRSRGSNKRTGLGKRR